MKIFLVCLLNVWLAGSVHPYFYNPYQYLYRYNPYPYIGVPPGPVPPYGNHLHGPFFPYMHDFYNSQILRDLPTMNVLAEEPLSIKGNFTVVSMLAVAKDNINTVTNPLIIQVSRQSPTMTVKTEEDELVQCIPAAKILLDKPLPVVGLKTSVPFPAEILIAHGGFKIPIEVGAVIAPVPHDLYVSPESPVFVDVVYAIPTKPFVVDYVNNERDVVINLDNQAVIVEHDPLKATTTKPPINVTVLEFPENEAEPTFQVDEEDAELVNRSPPAGVIPAGIIQSTQPVWSVQTFSNSKESPLLTTLREEAAKNRLKANTIASVVPSF